MYSVNIEYYKAISKISYIIYPSVESSYIINIYRREYSYISSGRHIFHKTTKSWNSWQSITVMYIATLCVYIAITYWQQQPIRIIESLQFENISCEIAIWTLILYIHHQKWYISIAVDAAIFVVSKDPVAVLVRIGQASEFDTGN